MKKRIFMTIFALVAFATVTIARPIEVHLTCKIITIQSSDFTCVESMVAHIMKLEEYYC